MGCIQIKKLNDNEIIKSNNIENHNYNPNNKLETNPNKNDENLILLNNNLLNKKQEIKCDKQITKKTNNKTLNETKHEITETKKQEIPINKSEFNKITKAEISEIDKKKNRNLFTKSFLI